MRNEILLRSQTIGCCPPFLVNINFDCDRHTMKWAERYPFPANSIERIRLLQSLLGKVHNHSIECPVDVSHTVD